MVNIQVYVKFIWQLFVLQFVSDTSVRRVSENVKQDR